MKSFKSIISLSLVLVFSVWLSSCSKEEPDSGKPIALPVVMNQANWEGVISANAMTFEDPFHVIAYTYDDINYKHTYAFESDAYIGEDGIIRWIGTNRNWANGKMKFVAYYPANAFVDIDEDGRIEDSDCQALAIEMMVSWKSENPRLLFLGNILLHPEIINSNK